MMPTKVSAMPITCFAWGFFRYFRYWMILTKIGPVAPRVWIIPRGKQNCIAAIINPCIKKIPFLSITVLTLTLKSSSTPVHLQIPNDTTIIMKPLNIEVSTGCRSWSLEYRQPVTHVTQEMNMKRQERYRWWACFVLDQTRDQGTSEDAEEEDRRQDGGQGVCRRFLGLGGFGDIFCGFQIILRSFNPTPIPIPIIITIEKPKSKMVNKWLVYSATYATYSLVHSIRTCWSSLKTVFTDSPFEFSQRYLGTLDMIVLFTIAILLNVLGGEIQKYSRRKLLFFKLVGLSFLLLVLFLCMVKEVTSQFLYAVLYFFVGVFSCLAWPICLYTTSQYFDSNNAVALSMWSSVSQCGDFVAFLITLIVLETESIPAAYSMLFLMILFLMLIVFDYFFFRDKGNAIREQTSAVQQVQTPQNQVREPMEDKKIGSDSQLKQIGSSSVSGEERPKEKLELSEEIEGKTDKGQDHLQGEQQQPHPQPQIDLKPQPQPQPSPYPPQTQSQPQPQVQPHHEPTQPPVTFLTVWLLPGVALPVLAFSTTKSINAIIVSWLVLYFTKIDMIRESRVIAIVWTFSIVLGGFIGAHINYMLSYKIFIVKLFISAIIFYFLEGLHVHANQFAIIGLVAVCGILVGGPFNQLGTSVPLKLSEDPQIRSRPKSKSTIISLMQSFGQMVCGVCILIVPSIGVMKLHYMAGALCFISVLLLAGEELRQYLRFKGAMELMEMQRPAAPPVQLKEEV